MTTTTTLDDRARRYLDEVRSHLDDLSDDERDDLVDDLAAHLHEVSATDVRPLDEVLGSPAAFAAELRASAGLPPEAPAADAERTGAVRSLAERVATHPWTEATLAFLPELRPGWWVARGALVGAGLGIALGLETVILPVLMVAGAVLSVRLGRRSREAAGASGTSGLARVAGWAIGAAAVVVLLSALSSGGGAMDVGNEPAQYLRADSGLTNADGRPVTNIYAYDRDGTPLEDVLLYDQDGEPLDLGADMADLYDAQGNPLDTNYPVDRDGLEVRNAYPLDQRALAWDERGRERGLAVRPPSVVVPPEPER